MIAERIRRSLTALLYCELASIALAFSICYFAFYARLAQSPGVLPYQPKNLIFFFIIVFVACLMSAGGHFYSELRNFISYTSISLNTYLRTSLITMGIIGGCGTIIALFLFSGWAGLIFAVYTLILCAIYTPSAKAIISVLGKVYNSEQYRVNIALVGINRRSVRFYKKMRDNSYLGLNITGFIDEENSGAVEAADYLGKPENVEEIITANAVNLILFFLPMRTYYDTCNKMVHTAEKMGVVTHSAGNLFERDRQQVHLLNSITGMSQTILLNQNGSMAALGMRRARDICVALFFCLIAWPLALLTFLLVLAGGGSPFTVSSEAVGKEGKPFRLYRFRTRGKSAIDGEEFRNIPGGGAVRLLHLDALPHIISLALGELTLFGPKPMTEAELEALPPEEQNSYKAAKPGLFKG